MKQATKLDFKFGALLLLKTTGQKIRVLNNVRGDEFDATTGMGSELTVHSREAHCYELLEDGSEFKPSDEFLEQVRFYD